MSLSSSEQVTATQKASLDMSLGLLNTAFEGFRKLAKLNLQAFKSTLVEGQDAVRERLSVKRDRSPRAAPHSGRRGQSRYEIVA